MKREWKIKFSILMIIAAIVIFGTNYLVLKDTHSIVSYVWLHIGFIPIDIIIVAFILEDIMSRKENLWFLPHQGKSYAGLCFFRPLPMKSMAWWKKS